MTNDECRAKWVAIGATNREAMSRITSLINFLEIELKSHNESGVGIRMELINEIDTGVIRGSDDIQIHLNVSGDYFDSRQCISFENNWVGFCGWASTNNTNPITTAFCKWIDAHNWKEPTMLTVEALIRLADVTKDIRADIHALVDVYKSMDYVGFDGVGSFLEYHVMHNSSLDRTIVNFNVPRFVEFLKTNCLNIGDEGVKKYIDSIENPKTEKTKDDVIRFLWKIIDNIDTAGDIAKSDDKLYRALVEREQKKRWDCGMQIVEDELCLSEIHAPNHEPSDDGF